MNWVSRIGFSLLIFLTISCKKDQGTACFVGRGEQVTERRVLAPFNKIVIKGRMNVELISDSVTFAEIIYGSNLAPGIKTDIEESTLFLDEKNQCEWLRETFPIPHIKIHYKSLNSIRFEGNDSLFCNDTIIADTFNLDIYYVVGKIRLNVKTNLLSVNNHSGATETNLSGITDILRYYSASNAPQNTAKLDARIADVTSRAYNDIHVFAHEILYYQIYDFGNIYLSGTENAICWKDSGQGALLFR